MSKPKKTRRPMTAEEIAACRALGAASFTPGTPHKRFARDCVSMARAPEPTITEAQAVFLRGLCEKYRRQLPAAVVEWARTAKEHAIKNCCQFCWEESPAAEWKADVCPKCGNVYDAILAQEGDD